MQIAVLRLEDNSIALWGGVSVYIPFLEWKNNLQDSHLLMSLSLTLECYLHLTSSLLETDATQGLRFSCAF